MTITLKTIPPDYRVPSVLFEVDQALAAATPQTRPTRSLLIGGRTSAGTVAEKVLTAIRSVADAALAFGPGSMLHLMVESYFKNNTTEPLDCIALSDNGGATAARWTLAFSGTATASGTIFLYLGGKRVIAAVAVGATASTVAAAVNTAINADTSLAVTSTVSTGTVTVTAKNGGTVGNDIDVRFNWYAGETTPAGVSCVITQTATGATDPTVDSTLWAAIGDVQYDWIALAFNGSAAIASATAEMADRFSWSKGTEGMVFIGYRNTLGNSLTLGAAQNSPDLVLLPMNAPLDWTPVYVAALAGSAGASLAQDPARPCNTLPLVGIRGPSQANRYTPAERDALLKSGCSTFTVDADGTVRIERLITTYQKNASGGPDLAWLDITSRLIVRYIRWDTRTFLRAKYGQAKLADDGTAFGAGQTVVTPSLLRAELIARHSAWEELGLVEDHKGFVERLEVERSPTDPSRANVLLPINPINGLQVVAIQIQFSL